MDEIYQAIDSVAILDSSKINSLLTNANFKLRYANDLLYKLSTERTDLLINYIDNKPRNEKSVLKAI